MDNRNIYSQIQTIALNLNGIVLLLVKELQVTNYLEDNLRIKCKKLHFKVALIYKAQTSNKSELVCRN